MIIRGCGKLRKSRRYGDAENWIACGTCKRKNQSSYMGRILYTDEIEQEMRGKSVFLELVKGGKE